MKGDEGDRRERKKKKERNRKKKITLTQAHPFKSSPYHITTRDKGEIRDRKGRGEDWHSEILLNLLLTILERREEEEDESKTREGEREGETM